MTLSDDLTAFPDCPECETNLMVSGLEGRREGWRCWFCMRRFE